MQIDWWGLLPARQLEGYLLLGLYSLALIVALVGTRRSWTRLPARRWLLFAVLCILALLLNNALAWHYPIARPPVPNRPQEASSLSIPLLGSLPILLMGGWVGIGPAVVAGLLAGLMRALFINGQMTEIFQSAFFGLVCGYLLQQDYRGRLSSVLRQPIVVGVLGRLLLWFLALPATFVYAPIENPLSALDFSWPLFLSALLPALVEGIIAGVLGQALYAALPTLRPAQTARAVPPYRAQPQPASPVHLCAHHALDHRRAGVRRGGDDIRRRHSAGHQTNGARRHQRLAGHSVLFPDRPKPGQLAGRRRAIAQRRRQHPSKRN